MKTSITAKIILAIFCLIVLPLVAGGIWFYHDLKANFTQMEAERGASDLNNAHKMIDYMGGNWESLVKINAFWEDLRAAVAGKDQDFIRDSLLTTLDVNQAISAIYVSDPEGGVLSQREVTPLGVAEQMPKLADKLGDKMLLTGLIQTSGGLQLVSMSKITDEAGTAPPSGILYFFQKIDQSFVEKIEGVTKVGVVLYDGKQALSTFDGFDQGQVKDLYEQVQSQQTALSFSSEAERTQQTRTYDTITDIFGQPFGFLGTETLSESGAKIRGDLLLTMGWAALIILVVGGLLTMYFYRGLSRPLQRISGEMVRVASGDLTDGEVSGELGRLTAKRRDEIGEIAKAFGTMTDGLRKLVARVHEESNLLNERSQEFAASTEEARGTLHLIAVSSNDITSLVERTFDQVEAASDKLYTLEHQAQSISAYANTAVDAAGRLERSAGTGQSQVMRSLETMQEIKASSETSETRVVALQATAEEIHAIVDRIKSISKQTGMLALNAAIEASRAGEHGRGFSIVAREVGKLSEQAHEATDEIEALVGRIKVSVVDVCETTGQLKGKLDEGVQAVQSTSNAFADILEQVQSVEARIREINGEAQKQAAITQSGAEAVHAVKEMASEMVASVTEASSATEEALTSMHVIAENSTHLADLAEDLLDDVSKFRV